VEELIRAVSKERGENTKVRAFIASTRSSALPTPVVGDQFHQEQALRDALSGDWVVHSDQLEGPENRPLTWDFILTLRVDGRMIKGQYVISSYGYVVDVSGSLRLDRLVKLEYTSHHADLVIEGQMWLRLADDGRTMDGSFSGYGSVTGKPIHGTLTMKKKGTTVMGPVFKERDDEAPRD
jgi:hypothetical protein